MKTYTKALIVALGLALPATLIVAQDADQPTRPRRDRGQQQDGPRDGQRPGGPGRGEGDRGRPMAPPIVAALDLNSDGEIDAGEIAKASESLKKLDKNGDGKLSGDEIRPGRPQGPRPPGGEGDEPRAPRRPRAPSAE